MWAHIFSGTETQHKSQLTVVVQIRSVSEDPKSSNLGRGQTSHMFSLIQVWVIFLGLGSNLNIEVKDG